MLGAIIGDIVGSRFEFNNHRNKNFELFTDECFATDDSIMTLCVAKSLLDARVYEREFYDVLGELTVKNMREIGRRYPNCGYGGRFYDWIFSPFPEPYNSYGNGAAMRISPVGFAVKDEPTLKRLSKIVTEVTHNHPEGLKGAEITAIAIQMARNGCTKKEIRERVVRDYHDLNFSLEDLRETYRFNETCQETVPQAIFCFLQSNSFEDAIRTAISIGGDSDTLAAITGGIAEAYYGVPDALRDKALTYLNPELRAIYDDWTAVHFQESAPFQVLTKYIKRLATVDTYGEWVTEDERVGGLLGYVRYTDIVDEFLNDLYQFLGGHYEYKLTSYATILEQHGIAWTADAMRAADVTALDAQCVLALLTGIVRADRFCEGTLLNFLQDGTLVKWLMRLREIDWERNAASCPYCSHWILGTPWRKIRVDAPMHETWYRCDVCGQFWIETERANVKASAEEAISHFGEDILYE